MTALKDFMKVYWPLALLALGGILLTLFLMKPAPPGELTLATGSKDGAYYSYGERYQRLLEEEGVRVILLETAGTLDNLNLLGSGDADAALLQGGLATQGDRAKFASLGGLFYEPLWVFVREDVSVRDFADLKTASIAIGAEGSGTRALAAQIRAEWGNDWSGVTSDLGGSSAAVALVSGDVDAAMFSASVDAPYIQRLLRAPNIQLISFPRAPALSRRSPALAPVTLLAGVVDIEADIPAENIELVAPVAQLGVRRDLHPALQSLLAGAAESIHSDTSILAQGGRFPDPDLTDLPLSKEARRYYRNGPSALRRYFSFGVASFLERAWILAIPLLTLMFPLVRAAPPIYRWRVRRKIYVWYDDLQHLEMEGRAAGNTSEKEEVAKKLEDLQVEIGKLEVPLSYTDDVYRLRSHVEFVKALIVSPGALPPAV